MYNDCCSAHDVGFLLCSLYRLSRSLLSLNTECGGGELMQFAGKHLAVFFSRRLSTSRLIVPLFLDYSRYVFGLCVRLCVRPCHASPGGGHCTTHRHRRDEYLDTLLANQPISDGEATDHCQKGAPQDGGLPELIVARSCLSYSGGFRFHCRYCPCGTTGLPSTCTM